MVPLIKHKTDLLNYVCNIPINNLMTALETSVARIDSYVKEFCRAREEGIRVDCSENQHEILDSITLASLLLTVSYIRGGDSGAILSLSFGTTVGKLLSLWKRTISTMNIRNCPGLSILERTDARRLIVYLDNSEISKDINSYITFFIEESTPSIKRVLIKYDL